MSKNDWGHSEPTLVGTLAVTTVLSNIHRTVAAAIKVLTDFRGIISALHHYEIKNAQVNRNA